MKIWILNHYATDMYFDGAGRHQSFGKYLIKGGHQISIFCSNIVHNSTKIVDTEGKQFITKIGKDDVPYVFIKTSKYQGNGLSRIRNMIEYYFRVYPTMKKRQKIEGKPDVILASSVHPLTLVAGIKMGKKLKIPCVCEVRDLWPYTLIEMGIIKDKGIIARILYMGEKWIYKRADRLIFTMPGGKDYLHEAGLDKKVDLKKVHNVNNGVDLEDYNEKKKNVILDDDDLMDDSFKAIYAGSIRTANHVDDLVDAAEICLRDESSNIKFIVYGDGDQRRSLEKSAKERGLSNIVFKGKVEKKYIPYILSKGDVNIVTGEDSNIGRYGISWNKLFEYMASGKPIVANYDIERYNFIEEYDFGVARRFKDSEEFAATIIEMKKISTAKYNNYKRNALDAASKFDYKKLTDKLYEILEGAIKDYD